MHFQHPAQALLLAVPPHTELPQPIFCRNRGATSGARHCGGTAPPQAPRAASTPSGRLPLLNPVPQREKNKKKNKKRSNASASYLGITEGNPWVLHRGRFPLTPPEPCRAATPRPRHPSRSPHIGGRRQGRKAEAA